MDAIATQFSNGVDLFTAEYYKTLHAVGITDGMLDQANNWSFWKEHGFDLHRERTTKLEILIAYEIFYFLTITVWCAFKYIRSFGGQAVEQKKSKPKSSKLTAVHYVIFVHNIALSIFSGFVFAYNAPIVYRIFMNQGFKGAVCEGFPAAYDGVYGWWNYLFYLSKFYEFIDTYIVLWRGRYPMFLQFYHHLGAPIGMWLVLTTRCTGGYLFVVENSFIHTWMYFYYAMSTIKVKMPGKKLITLSQIIQFCIGTSAGLGQIFFFGDCMTWGDKFTIWYHEIFAGSLIVLFYQFYKKAYRKKPASTAEKKKKFN